MLDKKSYVYLSEGAANIRSQMPPSLGRPPGTKTGRIPAGGYPTITPDLGGFFAGFVEGEATFSITRQPKRQNLRCGFSINVRADDGRLLRDLRRATRLGRLTHNPARGTSKPQLAWSVCAKSDCHRLIEILDAFPLRGRKSHDYAIWRAAANFWITEEPTRTLRYRDWAPMDYLKGRLHAARRYGPNAGSIEDTIRGLNGDWSPYLAGLFTAEGTFGIHKNGDGFAPKAQITLRQDDLALLREVQGRTGVGSLYLAAARNGCAPSALWLVRRSHDLVSLVLTLDAFPPRGRKAREYAIWREAALLFGSSTPRRAVRDGLAELRKQLGEARHFEVSEARPPEREDAP